METATLARYAASATDGPAQDPLATAESPSRTVQLTHSYGFESTRRQNIQFVGPNSVVSILGNLLFVLNTSTRARRVWHGLREGSLGAVALHPTDGLLAVGESNVAQPNIYILDVETLSVQRVLRGGSETGYSDVAFSRTGAQLASVGTEPDFQLTIWDWASETVQLRSKAFSQDVYRVQFAPDSDNALVTSGMGHIRFWTMAATFTGLKLQGAIGKFGASELTDIVSFVQLPGGLVLSSTETGNLLLWDDGCIKFELCAKGRKPCHSGRVEGVFLFESEVYTIGSDGYVRIWDAETIENVDTSSSGAGGRESLVAVARVLEIEPLDQIQVAKDAHLVGLRRFPGAESDFLLQDASGALLRLNTKTRTVDTIAAFHAGRVTGLAVSSASHVATTLGADGSLRMYDLLSPAQESSRVTIVGAERAITAGGTCLATLPPELDRSGSVLIAGFADGVVRILATTGFLPGAASAMPDLHLLHVLKPHSGAVTSVAISRDGRFLATAGRDKTLFFFRVVRSSLQNPNVELEPTAAAPFTRANTRVIPVGFVRLDAVATQLSFSPDNHERDMSKVQPDDPADSAFDSLTGSPGTSGQRLFALLESGQGLVVVAPAGDTSQGAEGSANSSFEVSLDETRPLPWNLAENAEQILLLRNQELARRAAATTTASATDSATPDGAAEESSDAKKSALKDAESKLDEQLRQKWTLTSVLYLESGIVLLGAVNAQGVGELRAARVDRPRRSRLLLRVPGAAVATIQLSLSQNFVLVGTSRGGVALVPFRLRELNLGVAALGHGLETVGPQAAKEPVWLDVLHRGAVVGVGTTFDDALVLTLGAEGGLCLLAHTNQQVLPSSAEEFVALVADDVGEATDIVEDDAYTIQESRCRSELDAEQRAADAKKAAVLQLVRSIRTEFVRLARDNEQLPSDVRLPRSALRVDPYLDENMAEDARRRVAQVEKQLAWNSERVQLALEKVRRYYLGAVACQRSSVDGISNSVRVSTFRTLRVGGPADGLQPVGSPRIGPRSVSKHGTGLQSRNGLLSKGPSRAGAGLRTRNGTAFAENGFFLGNAADVTVERADSPAAPADAASDAGDSEEARQRQRNAQRARRAEEWKQLQAAKPDANYIDPSDAEAIESAKTLLGDLKLKSDPHHVATEAERTDADHKRQQIFLLQHALFDLKVQFNERVLALSADKETLLGQIRAVEPELGQLAALLGQSFCSLVSGVSSASDGTTGDSGPQESGSTDTSVVKPQPAKDEGNSLAMIKARVRRQHVECRQKQLVERIQTAVGAFDERVAQLASERVRLEGDLKAAALRLIVLRQEWTLLKEFEKFDHVLAARMGEKLAERADLEQKMDACEARLTQKVGDMDHLVGLQRDLMGAFQRLVTPDGSGANSTVASKHADYLLKVLKRRLKRRAPNKRRMLELASRGGVRLGRPLSSAAGQLSKTGTQAFSQSRPGTVGDQLLGRQTASLSRSTALGTATTGSDGMEVDPAENMLDDADAMSDESDEMSDGSDGDGSGASDAEGDDAGDSDDFEETCPADLDPVVWEQVLVLRETRLDLDAAVAGVQKALETHRKEFELHQRKLKIIDAGLAVVESDAREYETQKQRKLNELHTVVPLRLHQIECYDAPTLALPASLTNALVISNDTLARLETRIRELHTERADVRRQQKDLFRQNVALVHSRREKQQRLEQLEEKLRDVQLLKFGRLVDLDALQRIGVDRQADELARRLEADADARRDEISALKQRISLAKDQLLDATERNTMTLERVIELSNAKKHIELELNARQRTIKADFGGFDGASSPDSDSVRLEQLVSQQSQRIEALRAEIQDLVRKPMREYPIKFRHVVGATGAVVDPVVSVVGDSGVSALSAVPTVLHDKHSVSVGKASGPKRASALD